jgi:hypothetical protein
MSVVATKKMSVSTTAEAVKRKAPASAASAAPVAKKRAPKPAAATTLPPSPTPAEEPEVEAEQMPMTYDDDGNTTELQEEQAAVEATTTIDDADADADAAMEEDNEPEAEAVADEAMVDADPSADAPPDEDPDDALAVEEEMRAPAKAKAVAAAAAAVPTRTTSLASAMTSVSAARHTALVPAASSSASQSLVATGLTNDTAVMMEMTRLAGVALKHVAAGCVNAHWATLPLLVPLLLKTARKNPLYWSNIPVHLVKFERYIGKAGETHGAEGNRMYIHDPQLKDDEYSPYRSHFLCVQLAPFMTMRATNWGGSYTTPGYLKYTNSVKNRDDPTSSSHMFDVAAWEFAALPDSPEKILMHREAVNCMMWLHRLEMLHMIEYLTNTQLKPAAKEFKGHEKCSASVFYRQINNLRADFCSMFFDAYARGRRDAQKAAQPKAKKTDEFVPSFTVLQNTYRADMSDFAASIFAPGVGADAAASPADLRASKARYDALMKFAEDSAATLCFELYVLVCYRHLKNYDWTTDAIILNADEFEFLRPARFVPPAKNAAGNWMPGAVSEIPGFKVMLFASLEQAKKRYYAPKLTSVLHTDAPAYTHGTISIKTPMFKTKPEHTPQVVWDADRCKALKKHGATEDDSLKYPFLRLLEAESQGSFFKWYPQYAGFSATPLPLPERGHRIGDITMHTVKIHCPSKIMLKNTGDDSKCYFGMRLSGVESRTLFRPSDAYLAVMIPRSVRDASAGSLLDEEIDADMQETLAMMKASAEGGEDADEDEDADDGEERKEAPIESEPSAEAEAEASEAEAMAERIADMRLIQPFHEKRRKENIRALLAEIAAHEPVPLGAQNAAWHETDKTCQWRWWSTSEDHTAELNKMVEEKKLLYAAGGAPASGGGTSGSSVLEAVTGATFGEVAGAADEYMAPASSMPRKKPGDF